MFGPVTKEDHALECAAARLRAERKVFRAQREVFLRAVKHYKADLEDASAELRADRRAVLAAVRHGMSSPLQYASAELRADREVVMTAVQRNAPSLQYASAELRADREVVMAAVKSDTWQENGRYPDASSEDGYSVAASGHSFEYASAVLRADRNFVLAAVRRAWCLKYASDELRADRWVVMVAVMGHVLALQYASAGLRADRKVVLAAVQRHASSLKFASNGLRADRKVVMTAVKGHGGAREYASAALQWDPEVYVEYLKCCGFRKRDHPELVVRCAELFRSCSAYSSLARDRDALGAAVGVRTLQAPHAALNGAPEALPIVHCLIARRQEVIEGHYRVLFRSYVSFVRGCTPINGWPNSPVWITLGNLYPVYIACMD